MNGDSSRFVRRFDQTKDLAASLSTPAREVGHYDHVIQRRETRLIGHVGNLAELLNDVFVIENRAAAR
jgi:hypothetical protein